MAEHEVNKYHTNRGSATNDVITTTYYGITYHPFLGIVPTVSRRVVRVPTAATHHHLDHVESVCEEEAVADVEVVATTATLMGGACRKGSAVEDGSSSAGPGCCGRAPKRRTSAEAAEASSRGEPGSGAATSPTVVSNVQGHEYVSTSVDIPPDAAIPMPPEALLSDIVSTSAVSSNAAAATGRVLHDHGSEQVEEGTTSSGDLPPPKNNKSKTSTTLETVSASPDDQNDESPLPSQHNKDDDVVVRQVLE
eukprot:7542977-Pyramimonas_sp.AAC.1